jgi:hypothetical protein
VNCTGSITIQPNAPTMAALTKLVPASQITYSTDYPYFDLGQFKNLEELGLSAAELNAIGSGNATRLIPRLRDTKEQAQTAILQMPLAFNFTDVSTTFPVAQRFDALPAELIR